MITQATSTPHATRRTTPRKVRQSQFCTVADSVPAFSSFEAGDLGVAAVGEVAGLLAGLEPGLEFLAEVGVGAGHGTMTLGEDLMRIPVT